MLAYHNIIGVICLEYTECSLNRPDSSRYLIALIIMCTKEKRCLSDLQKNLKNNAPNKLPTKIILWQAFLRGWALLVVRCITG